jgi:hypothetical protein
MTPYLWRSHCYYRIFITIPLLRPNFCHDPTATTKFLSRYHDTTDFLANEVMRKEVSLNSNHMYLTAEFINFLGMVPPRRTYFFLATFFYDPSFGKNSVGYIWTVPLLSKSQWLSYRGSDGEMWCLEFAPCTCSSIWNLLCNRAKFDRNRRNGVNVYKEQTQSFLHSYN